MDEKLTDLLQCLVQVMGRRTIPVEELRRIVGEGKQLRAYNLVDGSRPLTKVARTARIDQGSLSRTVSRWIENGVAFRLGEGKDARVLHLYPVPKATSRSAPRKRKARSGTKRA